MENAEILQEQTRKERDGRKDTDSYKKYRNGTYQIVSRAAYLAGTEKYIFEKEQEPPKIEIYEELNDILTARIVRNLCRLRTALLKNYYGLSQTMQYQITNLDKLPQFIPFGIIEQLKQDGVEIIKVNYSIDNYLIDINGYIRKFITKCQNLFPIWLDWAYIKELFIMPEGDSERGIKKAENHFNAHPGVYPYQLYLNWREDNGNILYNDRKFVTLLYASHNKEFEKLSYVTDAGNLTKEDVYTFLEKSKRAAIVVDCENSDPYKLYATLMSLETDKLRKIKKILLYNDEHAESTWAHLNKYIRRIIDVPIVHEMMLRINRGKSLVDMGLAVGTCREFYQNNIDSFIVVSSDSDYWALISTMPEACFLVMAERNKCGTALTHTLEVHKISYCYIDDFCTVCTTELKIDVVLEEVIQYLQKSVNFNINDLLEMAYKKTRVEFTEKEREQFFQRYIKKMRLHMEKNGDVLITFS